MAPGPSVQPAGVLQGPWFPMCHMPQPQSRLYPTSGDELGLRIEDQRLFFKGRVQKVFETTLEL